MVDTIELRTLGTVVKTTYEDNPNTNAYTDAEKEKLSGIEASATKNSSDSELLDRSKHVGFQSMATINGLGDEFEKKVDKVTGQGLSETNFTQDEKTKLAGLEGPHFKGTHTSLQALMDAGIDAVAGDYADVDGGAGQETYRCIWDVTNEEWVPQLGASTQLTGAQIKSEYEAQPDTNAYTDAEKSKLAGISAGATANSADSALLNRTNHTGTQAISTVTGLSDALDGKVDVVSGRGLSEANYTETEKDKLAGIDGSSGRYTFNRVGTWNASTNSPSLANGTGTQGNYYVVSTAGDRAFGGVTYRFAVNDWVVYHNGVWQRLASNPRPHRGTISPPIPALRAAPTGVVSSADGFYAEIKTLVAEYDFYSILQNGENIVIPSWATYARIKWCYGMPNATGDSRVFARIKRDGVTVVTATAQVRNTEPAIFHSDTGIIAVTPGEVFTSDVWHSYGDVTAILNNRTFVSVELFESI